MKHFVIIFLSFFITSYSYGQLQGQPLIDSLLKELPKQKEDTAKVNLLNALSFGYTRINPEEGIKYGQQGIGLSSKLGWKKGEANLYLSTGLNYQAKSDFGNSLKCYNEALKKYNDLGVEYSQRKSYTLGRITDVYFSTHNILKEIEYYTKQLTIPKKHIEFNFSIGIVLGIFIFSILYNTFLSYSLKEKSIRYIVRITCIYLISYFVIEYKHLNNTLEIYLQLLLFVGSILILTKSYIKFIYCFTCEYGIYLLSYSLFKKWIVALNIFFWCLLLLILSEIILNFNIQFYYYFYAVTLAEGAILTVMAYVLILFFKNKLHKNKGIRFIIIAQLILFAGVFVEIVLSRLYSIDYPLGEFSFAMFIICLSISVADKINYFNPDYALDSTKG